MYGLIESFFILKSVRLINSVNALQFAEWLLDGLAGFLIDFFIKKHLGNNEARYRRYNVCFPFLVYLICEG